MLGNVTCFSRCKQSLSKEKNKKNNHELQFIRDDREHGTSYMSITLTQMTHL